MHAIAFISFRVEITPYIHSFVRILLSIHSVLLLYLLGEVIFSGNLVVTPHVSMTEDL